MTNNELIVYVREWDALHARANEADRAATRLQKAIDDAYAALLSWQYVGGRTSNEAYIDARRALEPFVTQEAAQERAV